MAILDVYRIEISDEEILEVAKMADSHGEVQRDTDDVFFKRSKTNKFQIDLLTWFRLVVMSFFGTSRSLRCTASLKHMMGGQICFGRRKLILLLTFLIEIRMESLPGRNWNTDIYFSLKIY